MATTENSVSAGASADESSRIVSPPSSTLLPASFVKFFNASDSFYTVSSTTNYKGQVTLGYYDSNVYYTFKDDTPTFLLCPVQIVRHEIVPSKYANGMWRYVQKKYSYSSVGGRWERYFEMDDDNKVYVTGGHGSYDRYRYRKQEFVMNDGTKKMYAFREHPGKTKKMLSEYSKTEEGLNALLNTNWKYSAIWLDTSVPKTNELRVLVSLEFKQCIAREKEKWWDSYMLFVKIVRTKNGQETWSRYYPLKVSLTDFSTKGIVPPLFESELAEMVREQRGELKKELAEKVFHPMRVMKMMETYGEDWDEKV